MSNSILLDTLKGIKRERPPVWFMRQAGRVLPSYLEYRKKYSFWELQSNPEMAADITLLPVHDLGVDAAILFSDILVIPMALGMDLSFTDKGPSFSTPLSEIPEPAEMLRPDTGKLNYIYETIDRIIQKKPENIPLIGFCGAPLTVFCYMYEGRSINSKFLHTAEFLSTQPEKAAAIIEKITDITIDYATKQVQHGCEIFQLFDTHAGIIPFSLYNELFMTSVKRIAAAIKKLKTPFIYFPKGIKRNIKEIQPDTADYLSIDWEVTLENAREIVHPEIGLQGNLHPECLTKDKPALEEKLERIIPFGSSEYKWIFNLGHGLQPHIPFENVKFTVDWIKNADWQRT